MSQDNTIIIGSDHAGYVLKEQIKTLLEQQGLTFEDVGTFNAASVDYPDYGRRVAQAVSRGDFTRGILICGTGMGMAMVANKYPRVRAALCNDLFSAIMSRRHNHANILAMGGRVVGIGLAQEIVAAWLKTPFEGGRHDVRIGKIERPPAEF